MSALVPSLSTWVVIILLALNLLTSLIIMIVSLLWPKGKRITVFLYGLFFLLCPVVGLTCFATYQLLKLILHAHSLDSASLTFSTEHTKALIPPDEESELNYISIEDSLVMDDSAALRQLLMGVLKNRSVLEIPTLTRAITSEDVEASHYAAAAVTNFLSEFRGGLQRKLYKLERMPDHIPSHLEAIDYLQPVLEAGIMDSIEQRSHVYMMEGLMERMYTIGKWHLTSRHYLDMVDLLLNVGDYVMARKWVDRAKECRKNELNTYKCAIRLYYTMHSRDELFKEIEELKRSDVVIDKELLDLIRVLNGGQEET